MASRAVLDSMKSSLDSAICPEDIFGELAGDRLQALKHKNRQFAITHPDLASTEDKALAEEVFASIGAWFSIAKKKISAGTYGDNKPYVIPEIKRPYDKREIKIGRKTLVLTGLLGRGTFSDVHSAEFDGDEEHSVLLKIARNTEDNDLLESEFSTLKLLHSKSEDDSVESFCEAQRICVPFPVLSFFVPGQSGKKHRASLLTIPKGHVITVQELREEHASSLVLEPHVWWIIRRLWLSLWMAHLRGVVHGSPTPDNLLVYPDSVSGNKNVNPHMVVLIDWTMSAKVGDEHIPAIDPKWTDFYAPEVFQKRKASVQMDVFTSASTALYLLLGSGFRTSIASMPTEIAIPNPIRMLMTCIDPVPRHRPYNIQKLYEEFGNTLGERKFSPLILP